MCNPVTVYRTSMRTLYCSSERVMSSSSGDRLPVFRHLELMDEDTGSFSVAEKEAYDYVDKDVRSNSAVIKLIHTNQVVAIVKGVYTYNKWCPVTIFISGHVISRESRYKNAITKSIGGRIQTCER